MGDLSVALTFWDRVGLLLRPTQALLLLAAGADKKFRGVAKIAGDASRFDLLLASLHRFADGAAGDFNIVEP